MGVLFSINNNNTQVVEISTNNAYRYSPKTGNFFSNYFIMGGERFDMPSPESYLFGENDDLNFIGTRPTPFPYPPVQGNEPTKMLKSLVNIRKSSLKFVKAEEASGENNDAADDSATRYNVEFTFDADVKSAITIYYFATETISNGTISYIPEDESMNSETYHYKKGANQTFCQSSHILDPSKFTNDQWQYNYETGFIPIVIQCVVEDEDHIGHCHMTFATVELHTELGYIIKPLKQKQFIDGVPYLLQEIYGIENKMGEKIKDSDEETEETGAECVICMVEMRDTLILPCRHLCLCISCAENLRYQISTCPICRSNFRALLQLRAVRKKQSSMVQAYNLNGETEERSVSQEGVPPGYVGVSLFEALNGPLSTRSSVNDGTGTQNRPSKTEAIKGEKKKTVKKNTENESADGPADDKTGVEDDTAESHAQSHRSPSHTSKKSHQWHSSKPGDRRTTNVKHSAAVVASDTTRTAGEGKNPTYKRPVYRPEDGDADDELDSSEEECPGDDHTKRKHRVKVTQAKDKVVSRASPSSTTDTIHENEEVEMEVLKVDYHQMINDENEKHETAEKKGNNLTVTTADNPSVAIDMSSVSSATSENGLLA